MKIDKKEVLRYLGYKNQNIDNNMMDLIDICCSEIIDICKESFVYEIFDIERKNDMIFLTGSTLVLKDTDIKNLLLNSKKCVVMAATLGSEVDSKISYYSRFNITKGLIMDACATTAIEYLCDEVQNEIMENALKDNLFITTRYSPGYGDFSIDNQSEILNVLESYKKIGLSVTENNIMLPRKSVTAFIGLSEFRSPQKDKSCGNCKNINCNFRKDGGYCEK
ncbi:MAG TPA: vitamin B12 dependent-methionine synthase activation domain-containing protein [Clostridium sp.]|uniref:vitamin B12 dependent-methionine synthase activation domain-containing protein n=1 Tax=Clostridium sp. TaxID=1506 RepID=UPI002F951914